MRKFILAFAIGAFGGTIGLAMPANANTDTVNPYSCDVKERRLVCADGEKNTGVVAAAMANPITIENITKAGRGDRLLSDPAERELYRRSVERAHKRIRRHVDRMQRKFKRNRLSKADWEFMKERYQAGMKTYFSAMSLYHAKEWFSDKMDEQAEGDELKQ